MSLNSILDDTCVSDIQCFDDHSSLSYSNVLKCSLVLSSLQGRSETDAQQAICVLMSRGAPYMASVFAAWRAGFYVVPLNTKWPLQKNLDIIRRIQPAAVLIDDDSTLDDFCCSVLRRSDLFPDNNNSSSEGPTYTGRNLLAHDVAYVIFTSGSTGEPKGVVISAGAFRSYVDWTRRFFADYAQSQRLLLTSELTFDITMGDIAFALAFGTDIGVVRHNTNIPSVLAMIMRHQIDVLYSVPTTHLALVAFARQKKGADLSTLQLILSGGDRFPWQLVRDYREMTGGAHFYNVYGPTEVTINCFATRLDDQLALADAGKSVPIGRCFDSLDYVLLDDQNLPAPEGELCVTGPQLMLGYHSDPERTATGFLPDPRLPFVNRPLYRTGDIGYVDGGMMYLKGRIDGLVKIRGYRIHPDEVSKAIDSIPGVDVSAVVPFGGQSDAALAAFIKLKAGVSLSGEAIKRALKEMVPAYMIPARYEFVNVFPLNQSGKVDKKVLAGRL